MTLLYILSGIFIFLGIGVKYFKWYFLISGYNTMSKDQKKNVDIEPLGKLMGNFMVILGVLILGSGIAENFGYKSMSSILMILIAPLTIGLVIFAQRYDHNSKKNTTGKNNSTIKKSKTGLIAIISLTLGITVLVAGMLIIGILDPDVEVNEDMVIVSGMYKRNIKTDDILEVSLEDEMPKVLRKTNGFNMGYTLRGSFNLENEGNSSIFVHENKSPFVFIRTHDRLYIINFRESQETIELFNQIEEILK